MGIERVLFICRKGEDITNRISKLPKDFNGHICLSFPDAFSCSEPRPTREELEESLSGIRDQHLPKLMTVEILEGVFPYVQNVIIKERNRTNHK